MTVPENNSIIKFGTAIILAGGKSSRMGFDKQFLEIDEKRLMNMIVKKLEAEFNEIIIVTNKPEEYKNFGHVITTDKIVGQGPLSGIHAGLLESKSQYVFVIGCDMPNVNIDYIRYIKKSINEDDIAVCVTKYKNGIEPLLGFYSKDTIPKIEKYLTGDKRSIYMFLNNLKVKYIKEERAREYSPNWEMFLNLNNKEDLDNYLERYDL